MASSNYVERKCPQCYTKVGVRITYGIYPTKTEERANYPVSILVPTDGKKLWINSSR